ncbi:MAG: hypothetical protein KIT14_06280 [bacterium]|nr:hypothetical protein [bacterium]
MRWAPLLAVALAGCTCRLSGTPLDTMEKKLNPACWSFGDDPAPAEPVPPAPPPADLPATAP